MAEQVKSASLRTTLKVRGVETPVVLYKATADRKARKWDTDTPKPAAAPAPTPDPPRADPLAADPTPAAPVAPTSAPAPPRKGIRLENGKFIDLTKHLERAAEDSAVDRMEIIDFIASSAVPRERILGAYYLAGDTPVADKYPPARTLRMLVEAMRDRRRVALVRWTKAGKGQSLGVLGATRSGALRVLELAWADQVREPNERCLAHLAAEVTPEEVATVGDLIDSMAAKPEQLDQLNDPRAALEAELVARAEAGELDTFEPEEPEVEPDTAKLFEQLEAALAASA